MTSLREENLIYKGFLYFLLPSCIWGIFGIFFPAIYTIIPVHESDICLCSFFEKAANPNHWNYILLKQGQSYFPYRNVNTVAFFFVNWLFMMALIQMIYRIRHIHDETLIKNECLWIVAIWIFLSIA